jgi:ssDNA-binding Zn-finger/Zn-ribbon topoisomerase 1
MAGRSAVSSIIGFLIFTILLLWSSNLVSAEDGDFDISEGNIWSFDYVDGSTMQSTSNVSASDGDYINLVIPVSNSNTSSVDSSWSFSFGYGGQWYGGNTGILLGNQSFLEVQISFGPVSEGLMLCKLEINNSTEYEISELIIGPNPVNFTSAGDANLVLIGQPAHVGDDLTASILVHNEGTNVNSVRLELTKSDGSILVLGDLVYISPGSSREVSASFTTLVAGTQPINWRILSVNGGIDVSLNGTSYLEVRESQEIVVNIDKTSWKLDSGLDLDLSLSLSPGVNRSVIISVFMKSGNDYSLYQSLPVDLNPGIRTLNFKLGNPDASRLKISVSPNSWISLSGDAERIIELSPPLISPLIEITDISPNPASIGDVISISYTLENNGDERSSVGFLRVVGIANDIIFSESSTPEINAGDSFSETIEIPSWQYSQTTDIRLIWSMVGQESTIVESTVIMDSGSSASFDLPFSINAAIYGMLSGLAIVMCALVVYRVVSQRTPSTESSWRRKKLPESMFSRKNNIDDKIEVNCPSCNQRLNIPSKHQGSVKCPACTLLFSHSSLDEKEIDISTIESSEKIIVDEVKLSLESYSDNDLLPCPQCEQTLKVPIDKRPIRSRCPACRAEFLAGVG